MFYLLKLLISLSILAILGLFILDFLGYQVNQDYFGESKEACEQRLRDCTRELIRQGTENAKCDFNCVDPKIIIKKK